MEIKRNSRLNLGTCHYPVGKNIGDWNNVVSEYAKIIKSLVKKDDEIGLVCTGSSGLIISSLLFVKLKKYDVVVYHLKKDGEKAHSAKTPRLDDDRKLFIIDDFVCTGETLNRIIKSYSASMFEAIIICSCETSLDYANVKTLYCN